ncbi:ABC transporter ATP-binding protein [Gemmatimonadota bacterium]
MSSAEPQAPRGVAVGCDGLGYAYPGRQALKGVDLDAQPGEIVGLIGPNGSGKSTLIRILSGVLSDYTGSAKVDGAEVREHPRRDLARLVAVVPQETPASLPFSVLETVLMGRHPHLAGVAFETPADVRLAMEGLERSGAAHLADRGLGELSSGERQRVVFAKALAQQPRVLLLDEPTSFLDIRFQVELYDLVRALAKGEGVTVLTALHDLNLAAEYCDRIYLLRDGSLHASGPTDEVLTYRNLTEAFQTDVYVDTNDLTGKLVVIPLSDRARSLIGGDPPPRPTY